MNVEKGECAGVTIEQAKLHSLLRRQLKRFFGDQDTVPEGLGPFIGAVHDAYLQADEDRLMLERSLELSSQELLAANAAIRAEKERLDVTLHSIGEGVMTTDIGGRVRLLNRVAQELTGWSEPKAIGRPFDEVFEGLDAGSSVPSVGLVANVVASGRPTEPAVRTLRTRGAAEEGVSVSYRAAPLFGRTGKVFGVVVVCRDVTAERKVEDERVRASRLESLSLLAGGIAHDFNNILTALMGNISLAQILVRHQEQATELLSEASEAAERARDLTQQLLTFSKGGAPVKAAASVAELIDHSARFSLRGSNVHCEVRIAPDLFPVEIDKGQISQVLNNLIINADQAMPEGGHLLIKAENLVGREVRGLPLSADHGVLISVQDEGVGIPKEYLDKVFDPYFTTKQKGSGLGLATCYSVVKNHEGLLIVESEVGKGTTFFIYLPVPDAPVEVPLKTEQGEFNRGEGRLLVMDDEEPILKVVSGMLTFLGYQVETVTHGARALASYRRAVDRGEPFHAVILDLTVPGGLGGQETAARLRSLDPEVCLVASSGYSNDPLMANYAERGFRAILTKPYSLRELERVLAEVLSEGVWPVEPGT